MKYIVSVEQVNKFHFDLESPGLKLFDAENGNKPHSIHPSLDVQYVV